MASEVVSTISTLAGALDRQQIEADLTAEFGIKSLTFEAVYGVVCTDAATVQWPSIPAPSPVSAATEANALSATAITVSSVPGTLASYAQETIISDLAILGGTNAKNLAQMINMQNVVSGFDKAVLAAINVGTYGFSAEVAACDSYSEFLQAKYTLRNTGYQGPLRAILTEDQMHLIAVDIAAKYTPEKNDAFASEGYWGRLAGVDIWTVPKTWCPQNVSSKYLGAMWIHPYGLAAAYHVGPNGNMVFTKESPYNTIAERVGVAVHMAARPLTTTGGIALAMA